MTRTPKQTAALRKVATDILARPYSYNQGQWVTECGTAFCIAGHAVANDPEALRSCAYYSSAGHLVFSDNTQYYGERLLGLNDSEAEFLFAAWWTPPTYSRDASLADLARKVHDFLNELADGKSLDDLDPRYNEEDYH